MKATVTAAEAAKIMRSVGVSITINRLIDGIESGYYPFGIIKAVGPCGRRSVEIFRVDLERWLREKGAEL